MPDWIKILAHGVQVYGFLIEAVNGWHGFVAMKFHESLGLGLKGQGLRHHR